MSNTLYVVTSGSKWTAHYVRFIYDTLDKAVKGVEAMIAKGDLTDTVIDIRKTTLGADYEKAVLVASWERLGHDHYEFPYKYVKVKQ